MALERWKKMSEEKLAENPWWSYWHAKFTFKNQDIDYYYMKTKDTVIVIGIDEDGRMPMVKQYRCLEDDFTIEFPNGGVEPGQSLEEAAKAEFAQEAQLKADTLENIGFFRTNNGRVQEKTYVFIARNLSPEFARKEPTEEFEQLSVTPEVLENMIRSGEIADGTMLAAWQLAKTRIDPKT